MASKRVGSIHVEMSLNSAKVVTGAEESKRAVREAAREMKANIAEAKASIGLMGEEIGVHLPRHVRGFIAGLPGVAPALAAAFSATAVIAIGMAAFEAGKKIAEFAKKQREEMQKAQEETDKLLSQRRATNLELDVTNDKLEQSIAKIEKKPFQNGLKLAIDEALADADKLGEALSGDIEKIREILVKSNQGMFARTFGSSIPNDTAIQGLDAYRDKLRSINVIYDERSEKSKSIAETSKTERERMLALAAASNEYWNQLKAEVDLRQKLQHINTTQGGSAGALNRLAAVNQSSAKIDPNTLFGDQRSLIKALQRVMGPVGQEAARLTKEATKAQLEAQQSAAEDQRTEEERVKRLQQQATEAQRKAAQDQIKGFEAQLAIIKQDHLLAVGEETDFWMKMKAASKGKLAGSMVDVRIGTARQEEFRQMNAIAAKAVADQKKELTESAREFATLTEIMNQWDEVERVGADSTNQLNVILARNRDELRQVQLAHDVAMGGVSRYDAAVEAAAIHTREANEELARLRAELKGIQDSPGMRSVAQANRVADLQQKIASLEGARDRQKEVDEWAIAQTTAFGGINEAMGEMVARAKDVSGQMRDAFVSAISSVNGEILKSITGEKTDWKKVANGIFANISKHALETAEGSILGSLGFGGKADGSSEANALWVRMHGAAAESLAGNIGSSIFDSFKKDDSGDDSGSGGKGNWFSNLFSSLMPHASGGPISAGLAYMVGERGPEPFFPGVSGSMGTHEAMQAAFGNGGAGGGIHFHPGAIDARGSTDPAQTRALVQRGIMEAVPHILRASVKANADSKRRTIGSRG